MPTSSIALLLSLAFGLTNAMPWAEAEKTASYQVEEWSPKPTGVVADLAKIFKRDSVDVAIYQKSAGWASTSGLQDNGFTTCSSNSACYQNTYPGNYIHYTCGNAQSATQVVTSYSNQPTDVKLQQVFTGVTFGGMVGNPAATTPSLVTSTPASANTFSSDMGGSAGIVSPVSAGGSTTTAVPGATSSASPGTVAGATISSMAGVAFIAAFCFWLLRRRDKANKEKLAGYFEKDPFARPLGTGQRYSENDFVSPRSGHPDGTRNLHDTMYMGARRGSQHSFSTVAGSNPFADEEPPQHPKDIPQPNNYSDTAFHAAISNGDGISRTPSPYIMTSALATNPYIHEVADTTDPSPYHSTPPPAHTTTSHTTRAITPPILNPFADVAASNPFEDGDHDEKHEHEHEHEYEDSSDHSDNESTHATIPIHPPQSYLPLRRDTPSPSPPEEANLPLVTEIDDFSRVWQETVSTPLSMTNHGDHDSYSHDYTPVAVQTARSIPYGKIVDRSASGRIVNRSVTPAGLRAVRSEVSSLHNTTSMQQQAQNQENGGKRHPTASIISSYQGTLPPPPSLAMKRPDSDMSIARIKTDKFRFERGDFFGDRGV
ncbi:hypothetical protein G7Y89_g12904 [Cudoniella acicularis]|uniref:Uncharacterized protein n=1 Tax=Cudoniella acicularis TaxID=354080 RepID=A0A8H4RAB9_9HELO|nr:hypothetical protein G7Y89_g12904 [Cudoniella acicularis]